MTQPTVQGGKRRSPKGARQVWLFARGAGRRAFFSHRAVLAFFVVRWRGMEAKENSRAPASAMPKLGIDCCHEDFVLLEELHRSAGGSVYRAKHKSSGTEVVIKERTSAELGGKGRDAMRHELKLYERLPPHPNVIGLLGAYWRGGDAASSSAGYGAGGAMPHGARSPAPPLVRVSVRLAPRISCTGRPRPRGLPPPTSHPPTPLPSLLPQAHGWRWCSSTPSRATCTATSRPSARRASI
jgi:hypothetical protein